MLLIWLIDTLGVNGFLGLIHYPTHRQHSATTCALLPSKFSHADIGLSIGLASVILVTQCGVNPEAEATPLESIC
jgi:hypothetical protein